MGNPIVSSLKEQFRRALKIWRDAVSNIPDDQWKTCEIEYLIPARQVYHMILAAERYASVLSPDEYMRTRKYNLNWLGPVDGMPDKDESLKDIQWIEDKIMKWLDDLGDEGVLAEETLSPWTGDTVLDKALYLLRHTHHHLGELNAELVRRDIPRPEWTA